MTQAKSAEESSSLPWLPIQAVIWVVGLALLFWQGGSLWGFVILIAVSAGAQFLINADARRRVAKQGSTKRLLPQQPPVLRRGAVHRRSSLDKLGGSELSLLRFDGRSSQRPRQVGQVAGRFAITSRNWRRTSSVTEALASSAAVSSS